MSAAIQTAVIGALQRLPEGEKPHLGKVRGEVALALHRPISPTEIRSAVEALWFKGKLEFHTLRLSPSMQPPRHSPAASGTACEAPGGTESTVSTRAPVSAAPFRPLINLRHAPSSMEMLAESWRQKGVRP